MEHYSIKFYFTQLLYFRAHLSQYSPQPTIIIPQFIFIELPTPAFISHIFTLHTDFNCKIQKTMYGGIQFLVLMAKGTMYQLFILAAVGFGFSTSPLSHISNIYSSYL
jgi:hypothetical protein